jgi:hypothetical protein
MKLLQLGEIIHRRQHLILVRAGRRALHLNWKLPPDRTWDLITLVYDDLLLMPEGEKLGVGKSDWVVDNRDEPCKFYGVHRFFSEHPEALQYDAVMMPDDDLLFDPTQLNLLFELFEQSGADLGQPALTADSHFSHFVTLQSKAFLYRYTNFAEVMTPIMTARMIHKALSSFRETKSAWGLDYLWTKISQARDHAIVIIDKVPAIHTRPVGGAGTYTSLGIDPHEEMHAFLERHKLTQDLGLVIDGVLDPDFGMPQQGHLAGSYVAGLDGNLLQHEGFIPVFTASLPYLINAKIQG